MKRGIEMKKAQEIKAEEPIVIEGLAAVPVKLDDVIVHNLNGTIDTYRQVECVNTPTGLVIIQPGKKTFIHPSSARNIEVIG